MIDTSLLTAADWSRLLTGAAGCTSGGYRSVYVTERLRQSGLCVEAAHHDLPPRAGPASALPDNTAGEIG